MLYRVLIFLQILLRGKKCILTVIIKGEQRWLHKNIIYTIIILNDVITPSAVRNIFLKR